MGEIIILAVLGFAIYGIYKLIQNVTENSKLSSDLKVNNYILALNSILRTPLNDNEENFIRSHIDTVVHLSEEKSDLKELSNYLEENFPHRVSELKKIILCLKESNNIEPTNPEYETLKAIYLYNSKFELYIENNVLNAFAKYFILSMHHISKKVRTESVDKLMDILINTKMFKNTLEQMSENIKGNEQYYYTKITDISLTDEIIQDMFKDSLPTICSPFTSEGYEFATIYIGLAIETFMKNYVQTNQSSDSFDFDIFDDYYDPDEHNEPDETIYNLNNKIKEYYMEFKNYLCKSLNLIKENTLLKNKNFIFQSNAYCIAQAELILAKSGKDKEFRTLFVKAMEDIISAEQKYDLIYFHKQVEIYRKEYLTKSDNDLFQIAIAYSINVPEISILSTNMPLTIIDITRMVNLNTIENTLSSWISNYFKNKEFSNN